MSIRVGTQPIDVLVNGTITNVGPGTVYYKDDSTLTVADNDGFVLPGASVVLDGSQWIVSDTLAYVYAFPSGVTIGGGSGVDTSGWAKGDIPIFDGSGLVRGKKYRIVLTDPPYYMNKSGGSVVPTGGSFLTNDEAFQGALDQAYQFGGGELIFPAGTYMFNKTGKDEIGTLTANPVGWVTIRGAGRGQSKIKMTSNSQMFLSCGSTALSTSTYGKVMIEDLSFDGQNVGSTGGNKPIVLGSAGALTSWDGVIVRRCNAYNLVRDVTGLTQKRGVAIGAAYKFNQRGNAGPALTFKNFLIEDFDVQGGNCAVILSASVGDDTSGTGEAGDRNSAWLYENGWKQSNCFIDNIILRRVSHDTLVPNSGSPYGSSNVLIGDGAWVGRVLVDSCEFKNAGDTGLELNSCQDVTVENTTITDARTAAFYHANLGGVKDSRQQKFRYRNCTAIKTGATTRSMSAFTTNSINGAPAGDMVYEDCTYINTDPVWDSAETSNWLRGQYRSFTVRRFRALYQGGMVANPSSPGNASTIKVTAQGGRTNIILDDVYIYVSGTLNASSSTQPLTWSAIDFDVPSHARLQVRNIRFDHDMTVTQGRWQPTIIDVSRGVPMNETFGSGGATGAKSFVQNCVSFPLGTARTDWSQLTGALTVTSGADLTVDRLALYIDGGNGQFDVGRVGVRSDALQATTNVLGTTIPGYKAGFIHKYIDVSNFLEAMLVAVDSTHMYLCVDKTVAGVAGSLLTAGVGGAVAFTAPAGLRCSGVGVLLASPPAASSTFTLRGWMQGNTLRAEYDTSSLASPTTTASASAVATLAGTDVALFGSDVVGRIGLSFAAQDAAASIDNYQVPTVGTLIGEVENVWPTPPTKTTYQHIGVNIEETTKFLRLRDRFRVRRSNFAALAPATTATGVSIASDAVTQGLVDVRDCTWPTIPAPSAQTVGGSPYTYTNVSGYPEDVALYGGTVTQVSLTRLNNAAAIVQTATPAFVRLDPGDAVTVTYSVAPTMRRVPVA